MPEYTPDPKPKRIRLKGKDYTNLRKALYERSNGFCETCGRYVPLMINGTFDERWCGHVHHKKSRGAGGSDELNNLAWLCAECHGEHNAPMWSSKRKD